MDIQRSKLHYEARRIVKSKLNFLVDSYLSTSDLVDTRSKSLVRIKPDTYALGDKFDKDYHISNNMFIETTNVDTTKQSGGPFQAYELGNTYFYYLYLPNQVLGVIKLSKESIDKLESLAKSYKDSYVRNDGYYTIGKAIPVERLKAALGDDFGLYQL